MINVCLYIKHRHIPYWIYTYILQTTGLTLQKGIHTDLYGELREIKAG